MGVVQLRWSVPCDGVDGIEVTPEVIFLACGEVAAAFDADSGRPLWESIIPDLSGSASISLHDETLRVTSWRGDIVVLDAATGELHDAVTGDHPVAPVAGSDLPADYAFEQGRLSYGGDTVWTSTSPHPPLVVRVQGFTVVNDDDQGVRVVDDAGHLMLEFDTDGAEFPGALCAERDVVIAATSDGVLLRIDVS